MNIVFHRYGNICEPDVIDSFKRLGVDVIEDDIEINQKSIDGGTRIQTIAELILKNHPMFVFSINYFPYISQICERLDVIYICLSVDCPVLEIYSDTIKNGVNRVFLFDYAQYLSVVEYNTEGIFYIPLATNTERWNKVLGDSLIKPNYLYDVSFVGSLYNEFAYYHKLKLSEYDRGFFDAAISAQLEIDGLELLDKVMSEEKAKTLMSCLADYDIKLKDKYNVADCLINENVYTAINYILGMEISALDRINLINGLSQLYSVHLFTKSDTSILPYTNVHESVSTHTEMPKVFSQSKINLNITMRGIRTGLSQRIWDVLGCGGFLITDFQSEIPDYFENGKDLVMYETPEECAELIDYYLKNEEERREIALSGLKKVNEIHTFDLRIAQIIKTVFQQP